MTNAGANGVVAIKNGTHQTNRITVSHDNITFVGESTEAVLSSSTSSAYGCSVSADNQNRSFTLETLKVYHNSSSNAVDTRTIISGGNTAGNFVKIYGCILEMGPNTYGTTSYNRGMFGGRNNQVDWTIHDTQITSAATTGGILLGGSNGERPSKSMDMQRCTIYVAGGTATLLDGSFASLAGGFTYKNNILYGSNGSEVWNSLPVTSSNNCYYNTSYSSSSTGLGTGNIFADPLFVDVGNKDFRLRPGSPCIDDSEPSLQDLYPNAIWVSGGYSGTQAGTYSQPYDDLRTAVDSTASSDIVICVKAGTTSLVGGNYVPQQHTSVTIIGENGTTIDSGGATAFGAFFGATGTYTFKNIDFLNNATTANGHIRGFIGDKFDHLVLEECTYKSADTTAQRGPFKAKKITAKNCFFESYVLFVSVDVHVLNHTQNGLTAENCTFYNKKNNFAGSISGSADQTKVLQVSSISNTATYTNCIFYAQGMSNTTTGLTGNNFTGKTFTDCCVYSPDSFLDDFTASQDSGTPVLSDPLFVDRTSGDFRLRPGSPCITI
jgi:hypothetical protein